MFRYAVEECAPGWRVRNGMTELATGLTLGKAIKHARQAADEAHKRTGCAVTVELMIPEKPLLLASYPAKWGRANTQAR